MQLEVARLEQLKEIMSVIEDGRLSLKELGLNQWQEEYPAPSDIENDIRLGISYALINNGEILATVALDDRGEPVYEKIDGQWQDNSPYIAVHRMAVKRLHAHKGLGTKFLQLMEEVAKDKNISQIRLDTHENNTVMQKVASKNNYRYAGKVNYGVDFDCVAFDKILI